MSHRATDDPTVHRHLARPPAEVWEQLTSREGFEHWMGTGSTIEPEPGGQLVAADPESGVPKTGRVLEVDPERRLRWAWRPLGDDPDEGGATEVLVELEPLPADVGDESDGLGGNTLITVVERPTTLAVGSVANPTASASVAGTAVAGCAR